MTKIETMDISKCIDVIDTMVRFGHLNQCARLTLIMSKRYLEEKKQRDRMVCGNCEKLREDGWCSFYKYYNAGGYVFYHEPDKCDYCINFDPKEDYLIERKESVMSEAKCMDDAGEYYETKMNKTLKKIADHYGIEKQSIQCVEELNELACAILHYQKNRFSKEFDNVIKEMADVEIMLEQMKYMYGIGDSFLDEIKQSKIKRQLETMDI